MRSVTRSMLDITFDSLASNSFGDILTNCVTEMDEANQVDINKEKVIKDSWGETVQIGSPFVLDISNLLPPAYATPVSIGDFIKCCIFRLCLCNLGG